MADVKWVSKIVTIKLDGKEYTDQVSVAGLEQWLATYQHKDHFIYKKNQAFYDKLTEKKDKKREEKKDGSDNKAERKSKSGA